MRAMKDSGIEWIGKIPQAWETKKLKYCVDLRLEKTADKTSSASYIGLEHVSSFTGTLCEDYEAIKDFNGDTLDFSAGDVLFGKLRPYLAKAYQAESEGRCSSEFWVMNPRRIEGRFLLYYILSHGFISDIDHSTFGVKMPRAEWSYAGNEKIPVPSRQEQTRITQYLDAKCAEIDALIAAKEKTNALLKERRQSIIYEAVTKGLDPSVPMKDSGVEWIGRIPEGWELKRLKYLGSMTIGLTYSPEDISDDGILVLRSSNIQDGMIVHADDVFVSKDVPEKLKVREGDILICSRNGSRNLIGKNAVISEEFKGQTFGAFMTIFRGRFNYYIKHLLNSSAFEYYIGSFLTSTINQLTTSNLSNILVPVPSKEEEMWEIAEHIETECRMINPIITMNDKMIQKLREYRQTLIYEAVTGKIEV